MSGQPSDEEIVNHLTGRTESQRVTELIRLATTPARVHVSWEPPATPIPPEDWFQQKSTDGGQTWNPPLPKLPEHVFADPIDDEEWDLIGLVCDRIDEANPDLPIEQCQRIARDIIALARERT